MNFNEILVFSFDSRRVLTRNKKELEFTLPQFLKRQKNALHGYESRVFRYLPKVKGVVVRSRTFGIIFT